MKIKIVVMISFLLGIFINGNAVAQCIQDPVAYWTLDQNTPPYLNEMADSYRGDCAGMCPAFDTNGRIGNSQVFNGNNTGITIQDPGDAIFDFDTSGSFSIGVWFRRDPAAAWVDNEVFVGRYQINQVHFWIGLENNTGRAHFRLWDSVIYNNYSEGAVTGTQNLDDGEWHHMVAVRDGQTNQNIIYVDGVEEASIPITYTGTFTGTAPMTIGWLNSQHLQYRFNGNIDEVIFFNEALTSEVVSQIYDAGQNGTGICEENHPPQITSKAPTTATVGVEYVYNPTAEDPEKDQLTWSLINAPDKMVIDETTGAITWTPPAGITTGLITLVVRDLIGGQASQDFTIAVDDGTNSNPNNSSKNGSGSGGGCFIDTILQ